jgi:superfamily II DNA/RNA helicase
MSIFNQVKGLRNFHNVVIGTPGRLKDLYERRSLILSGYTTIVLDEVDRMLDMGFIRDIEFLLDKLPKNRQSLFFSATINRDVEVVMTRFVKEYVKVSVKTRDNKDNISQSIVEVSSPTQKLDKLKELIKTENMERAIVFVRTKRGADKLDEHLYAEGYKVAAIHGDKRQSQRLKILDAFKAGKLKILIATDVVARGIDVHDVTHIINFDLPESLDDYIHRIGRTGRADKKGIALTFIESGYSRY